MDLSTCLPFQGHKSSEWDKPIVAVGAAAARRLATLQVRYADPLIAQRTVVCWALYPRLSRLPGAGFPAIAGQELRPLDGKPVGCSFSHHAPRNQSPGVVRARKCPLWHPATSWPLGPGPPAEAGRKTGGSCSHSVQAVHWFTASTQRYSTPRFGIFASGKVPPWPRPDPRITCRHSPVPSSHGLGGGL
jgi:hypothetical protein